MRPSAAGVSAVTSPRAARTSASSRASPSTSRDSISTVESSGLPFPGCGCQARKRQIDSPARGSFEHVVPTLQLHLQYQTGFNLPLL